MKSSCGALSNNRVIDWFTFENNKITLFTSYLFYLHTQNRDGTTENTNYLFTALAMRCAYEKINIVN